MAPVLRHRCAPTEQPLDDPRVLHRALVAVVVGGGIAEREQIVRKAAGQHVEIDAPAVDVGEGRHQLGDRIGMRVGRLDGDEG